MNTKQIEILLTVSEALNFTKAAKALYLSQPSLTYQIKMAEEELRFQIFDRSQKSVSLTPAGKNFIENLRKIDSSYKRAVEEAQNYSDKYNNDIVISLPYRSALPYLPEAMIEMNRVDPSTLITPKFGWLNRLDDFVNGDVDILFEDFDVLRNMKGIQIFHLYQSHIYLVCRKEDPLAQKELLHMDDLKGRTLMVGGGSQHQLKIVQNRVLDTLHIPFFNSDDHDTTLTNIAANRAIVLAPGFLHDQNDGFAWVPFDCKETIDCCLVTKENDSRICLKEFLDILFRLDKQFSYKDFK